MKHPTARPAAIPCRNAHIAFSRCCVPADDSSAFRAASRPQYFVSSGFAFIHADSTTDVCAVEAVPIEQLDPELVKQVSLSTGPRGTRPCCRACLSHGPLAAYITHSTDHQRVGTCFTGARRLPG